jgi:hypothetical protein
MDYGLIIEFIIFIVVFYIIYIYIIYKNYILAHIIGQN